MAGERTSHETKGYSSTHERIEARVKERTGKDGIAIRDMYVDMTEDHVCGVFAVSTQLEAHTALSPTVLLMIVPSVSETRKQAISTLTTPNIISSVIVRRYNSKNEHASVQF